MKRPQTAFSAEPIFDVPTPQALGWRVVVKPKPPEEVTKGGIVIAGRSRKAEASIQTIGQVVSIGALAWGKTKDIDLGTDPNLPKVGDWIVFRQHSGQKLRVRMANEVLDEDGVETYLLIMDDQDILLKLTPEQVERFYHWV